MKYKFELKATVDKDTIDKITQLVEDDIHDKDLLIFTVEGVPELDAKDDGAEDE